MTYAEIWVLVTMALVLTVALCGEFRGGLYFFRIGRFGGSFYLASAKPAKRAME